MVGKISKPHDLGKIIAGVCGHFQIDPETLRQNCGRAPIVAARSVICYLAVRHAGYSGTTVVKEINIRRAAVSIAATRGEKIVSEKKKLMELLSN
jgi:chromosomal replication initiation ATPase DnaA